LGKQGKYSPPRFSTILLLGKKTDIILAYFPTLSCLKIQKDRIDILQLFVLFNLSPPFNDTEIDPHQFSTLITIIDGKSYVGNFALVSSRFLIYLLTIAVIMLGVKDLCQADSKSFSMQWSLLLPTSDALQPRYGLSILLAFTYSDFYYHVSRAICLCFVVF